MAYPTNPIYKLYNDGITGQPAGVKTEENGLSKCIPLDPGNSDYQAYLDWAKENTAEPAD